MTPASSLVERLKELEAKADRLLLDTLAEREDEAANKIVYVCGACDGVNIHQEDCIVVQVAAALRTALPEILVALERVGETETFDQWWYDYRIKNGLQNPKRLTEVARTAWAAAASQDVPHYVKQALLLAHEHSSELREAWRSGALNSGDSHNNRRANKNMDVEVALRNALELLASRTEGRK